jgi:hypothetical protein
MSEILTDIPDVIYKYRDYDNEWNRKTLFDYELYMASMSQFNDPFEGKLPFQYRPEDLTSEKIFLKLIEDGRLRFPEWSEEELHKNAYEKQQEDFLNDDVHMKSIHKMSTELIEKNFGILSLAENPKNYLMWSHYAKSHTGFAVGFDKHTLFHTINGAMGKVIYDDEFPSMSLFDSDKTIGEFHTLLSTKSKIWEYEKEVRVTKHKASKGTIPYPKEMIKEIYFGASMAQENKDKIISFIKGEKIDCKIFELSLSKARFELDSLRIY